MELDSVALEIRLLADKLANLRAFLLTWRGKRLAERGNYCP